MKDEVYIYNPNNPSFISQYQMKRINAEQLLLALRGLNFEEFQAELEYNDTKMLQFIILSLRHASPMNEINTINFMADILTQQLRRGGHI